ncbi:MAG: DUF2461 domain-containing protein [Prevotella sp.]|jgi:uncharacterized protein (TIGR02453 family)
MDTKRILKFLKEVAANNNRQWMDKHRDEYLFCKKDFENGVADIIATIAKFDSSIAHLVPKDCCYRFNRDIRFSQDKSPYKRHFGAYISAHGKKSLHAGYYVHLQPGNCMLGGGAYWLPTNILTSMRNEIMGNIDAWRRTVENGKFIKYFGYANEGEWTEENPSTTKGFGLARLKTAPKDFPRDYEFIDYLRMKDYCVWHCISDDFFTSDRWKSSLTDIFKTAKPMMDFINSVIDDYE